MKIITLTLAAAALALAGCGSSSIFDGRFVPDRAAFGNDPIPAPATPALGPVQLVNPDPVPGIAPTVVEQVTGTWTFTTPSTTTRVEKKTAEISQFSIYNGRPAPTDTPFVVITVSADTRGIAESDPAIYKIANTRTYALNGNVAQEWTGNTTSGRGFCELLIKKPGNLPGDVCHAMAVVKDSEEQKLALEILASIRWTPAGAAATQAAGVR